MSQPSATVGIDIDPLKPDESQVGAREVLPEDEPPRVRFMVWGDWGEVNAHLSIEDARDYRDRLTEVIEVAEAAEDPTDYEYLCDHCLAPVDPEQMDEENGQHYHPDCPHQPAADTAA